MTGEGFRKTNQMQVAGDHPSPSPVQVEIIVFHVVVLPTWQRANLVRRPVTRTYFGAPASSPPSLLFLFN